MESVSGSPQCCYLNSERGTISALKHAQQLLHAAGRRCHLNVNPSLPVKEMTSCAQRHTSDMKRGRATGQGREGFAVARCSSSRASVLRAHHTADCILPHTLNIKIWNASERCHRGAMLPLSRSASANPSFLLKRPQCVYGARTLVAHWNQTKHLIITVYF